MGKYFCIDAIRLIETSEQEVVNILVYLNKPGGKATNFRVHKLSEISRNSRNFWDTFRRSLQSEGQVSPTSKKKV